MKWIEDRERLLASSSGTDRIAYRELAAKKDGTVLHGAEIDQTEFPVPRWHFLGGGRYIHTFSGIVTRNPDTRVMNLSIYRRVIGRKDTTPFRAIKGASTS